MKDFLTQYAAVRFATGGRFRRPSVLGQLLKAAALIMVMALMLPVALLRSIRVRIVRRPTEETAG